MNMNKIVNQQRYINCIDPKLTDSETFSNSSLRTPPAKTELSERYFLIEQL